MKEPNKELPKYTFVYIYRQLLRFKSVAIKIQTLDAA